jgi:hypothetical protein
MTPVEAMRRSATLTRDGTERTVGLESHPCKLSTVAGADVDILAVRGPEQRR